MKIVTVLGARPQFIKSGAVSRAVGDHFSEVVIHTGQHYDDEMSDVFFRTLNLRRPDHYLQIGSGTHGQQTGRMLEAIEDVLLREEPDFVLVYGDTNSTLAGALAAAKLHIRVAHVEAGLRSFNRRMPEEVNRVLTDHVSSALFCPTPVAVANLRSEGVTQGVELVGDVMLDVLDYWVESGLVTDQVLGRFAVPAGGYYLATIHRAENTGERQRLDSILRALQELDLPVLFPVHPRTRGVLERFGLEPGPNVHLADPVGYVEMVGLERHARAILTDSGGVQKEAYMLGVPCVTLREETEWVETVTTGWNRLAGWERDRIVEAVNAAVPQADHAPLYGDAHAGERIVDWLLKHA